MTNSELSKQIPLEKAIKTVDSIVAECRNLNRTERQAVDLSMIRISEAAQESEKLKVEVEELKSQIAKSKK